MKARIASGELDVRTLSGQSGGIFRYRDGLRGRLWEILMRVRNFGIGQVSDELERQR